MKRVLLLLLCVIGCKPSPTYNPFDKQFDISINEVIKDGCIQLVSAIASTYKKKKVDLKAITKYTEGVKMQ